MYFLKLNICVTLKTLYKTKNIEYIYNIYNYWKMYICSTRIRLFY